MSDVLALLQALQRLPESPYGLVVALGLILLPVLGALWGRYARRQRRRQLWARQRDLATLRALTWQEFEVLTGETFRHLGYRVTETGGGGADHGVDLLLVKDGRRFVVQCKHYRRGRVGAPILRETIGVALHVQAAGVFVVTCGRFTRQAIAYAEGKPITLIDGVRLVALIDRAKSGRTPRTGAAALPRPVEAPGLPAPSAGRRST